VLDFWFGAPNSRERGQPRKSWFEKSEAFDAEIRRRFSPPGSGRRAASSDRASDPLASLALVVALDQFPRNMFRGTERAFASDSLALAAARNMIALEFDRLLSRVERSFATCPRARRGPRRTTRSLAMFHELDPEDMRNAKRHYEIIARFGRFPHRNAHSWPPIHREEAEFLKQPGSSF